MLSVAAGLTSSALAQEDPPVMLQWFECKWADIERKMPDFFIAGYGSVWLPPPSKCYIDPRSGNQNGTSAGYDPLDRFDLGRPGAQTAFGTETTFREMVKEFHRANAEVYIDAIFNHNAFRQTSQQFHLDGGWPGFWLGPTPTTTFKSSTGNWGDFNAGNSTGFYQSENPGGSNYCLLKGDLVALCDIDQATNHQFIRQPVAPGNPQNIPAGTYFNQPDAGNARFYYDSALGTTTVNNPGMSFAGPLTTGIYSFPCDVPARNEPPINLNLGRFNTANPSAGDAVAENATGYLMRWAQWMFDVQGIDGMRLDAAKHTPSWFFDSYIDAVFHNRRLTPDGRLVTAYSFVESVEGNDFTFDRYVRKPNGRTTGRSTAGDAFGNRDALDLAGAGRLRDLINGNGTGTWQGGYSVFAAHIDSTDDGFNNGTVGMNHIYSHDNGTVGNGSSAPANPTNRQQGWYAHAYLALRPGVKEFYHNARGVSRTSGFWPRAGVLPVFGVEPITSAANTVLSNLVQNANQFGRGEFTPRWVDDEVMIFERRTPLGGGAYSSTCVVAANDRLDAGYDERTIFTNFPANTRLYEQTGNATSSAVDPTGVIFDSVVVNASGQITVRVPRNVNANNAEHNKGFVIYAPALPAGTLAIVGATSTIPAEGPASGIASWRRRSYAIPVVTTPTFTIDLTTTNGDPAATNNDNADDNALFRLNAGYADFNGNAVADYNYTAGLVAGYEEFVTLRQPLANTGNTQGRYQQVINTAALEEGMNYLSVIAFAKRPAGQAPIFREFRTAVYVDRLAPTATLVDPGVLGECVTQFKFQATTPDRQISRLHLILNPTNLSNPPSLATTSNIASQDDRFLWSRTLTGLNRGANTVLLVAFEDSGRSIWQTFTVTVNDPGPCDAIDFNNDGVSPDTVDIDDFLSVFGGGACSTGTCNDIDYNNDCVAPDTDDIDAFLRVFGGGNC
jgi:glycosidase